MFWVLIFIMLGGFLLWPTPAVPQAWRDAVPMVTMVEQRGDIRGLAIGSGVNLGAGSVLTANHIVRDGSGPIRVRFNDGRDRLATVGCRVASKDLAMLYTITPTTAAYELQTIPQVPKAGSNVIVRGYPSGQARAFWGMVEEVLNFLDVDEPPRTVTGPILRVRLTGLMEVETWVRDKAGLSGGPVMNVNGTVIGIVVAKELDTVIPSNIVHAVVADAWGLRTSCVRER